MKRIHLLAALAAGFLAVAVAGCGGRGAKAPEAARDASPVAVRVVNAGAAREAGTLVLPARIEASEEVTLTARVPGRVTRFPVAEGATFHAGDPLALFDAPEARAALDAAEAGWAAAKSRSDLARRQEARMDSLYADRVVSLHELEVAQAERRGADAALAQAEAARAEWETATRTPAPFDGVVVRHRVDEGASLSPGAPIVDVRSSSTGLVAAAIPEQDLDRIGRGGTYAYQVGDGPWRPAALVRVEGMIDPATRSKMARFRPATRGERLEAGAYARIRLAAPAGAGDPARSAAKADTAEAAVIVPASSVVRRGALTGVFVVKDAHAVLRWVRLGRALGGDVEVIAGLDRGEPVVVDPASADVEDGRAVEARP
ncbi:MAG: efflux RND transporter periplasmic adaptor subunit [Hyphomicrobiales bacterium]